MAERKSGPVKPPVIDLKARETDRDTAGASAGAGAPEQAAAQADKPAEAQKPQPAAPKSPGRAPDYLPLGAAALAGGVIGAGLSLLLAYGGAFPKPGSDPRLDQLEQRLSALGKSTDAADLAALKDEVATIKAQPPVDLAPLRSDLSALSTRLDALAAGATGAEASQLGEALSGLTARLDAAEQKLAESGTSAEELRGEIARLETALAAQKQAAESALAEARANASQLPLILAELDAALAAGRPYGAELARLRTLDADRVIPARFAASAETGLPRPEALLAGFRSALPDIASSIPAAPDASWQDQAFTWARNLLALRPSEEMAGDSPEAVLSRLEGAMERRDFAAAAPLFAQLPEPMRAAAGALPGQIAARAEGEALLADLRQQALAVTPEAGS